MKFRFPIVIIDEDFRTDNTSGLGIRALAEAMEKEGMEVLGLTDHGDLGPRRAGRSRRRQVRRPSRKPRVWPRPRG